MAGTYVDPHEPALGAVDPADVGAVESVHEQAQDAALGRREHYHQNILGQGANAGDLQDEAEPTQQSMPTQSQNPQSPTVSQSTL